MKTSVTSRQPLFSGKMGGEKTHIAQEGRPTGTDMGWDQRCARHDEKSCHGAPRAYRHLHLAHRGWQRSSGWGGRQCAAMQMWRDEEPSLDCGGRPAEEHRHEALGS